MEYCKFHSVSLDKEKVELLVPDLIFWRNTLKIFSEKWNLDNFQETEAVLYNLLETTVFLDYTEEIGRRELAYFLTLEFLAWDNVKNENRLRISKAALKLLKTIGGSYDFLKFELLKGCSRINLHLLNRIRLMD